MNKSILCGRVVKDAELKFIPTTGTAVGQYTLAVDRKYKDKEGNKKTDFINCVQIGKHMENLVQHITKGKLIFVDGELNIDNYQDSEGNWKSRAKINVERLEFVPVGKKDKDNGEATFTPGAGLDPQGFQAIDDDELPF